ncbi:MAG TPA: tetratricopeptide repeat protein [Thermoflexia bacterium]|jgi:tetratricopeptide (TPR) repeat protein|nr:tetratricopeptide repeat protein [Thermoflexia bacterium]
MLETISARRRLFVEQIDRLVAFSLEYIRRHRQDVHALDRQRDNLLQMVTACGQYLGDWHRAARIALGLDEYMMRRGHWRSWAAYLEDIAHALAEERAYGLEGEVWRALGNAYCGSGQWEPAYRAHRRAIGAFRRAGDARSIAYSLFDLGRVRWFQGEWQEALRCYRQAETLARSLPDDSLFLARIANVIGLTYWRQGRWRWAVRHFRRALRLCPDDPQYARNRGRMMSNLALALTDLGRWEEAERSYRAALQFSEQAGDTTGLAYTWGDLSDLYRRQRRWEEAEACLERAEALWERAEDAAGQADHAEHRGRLCADRGEVAQARHWLDQALKSWGALGNEHKIAELQILLAEVAVRQGSYCEADQWMKQARFLAHRLGRRDLLVRLHALQAAIEGGQGRWLQAVWTRLKGLACGLPALRNDRTWRAVRELGLPQRHGRLGVSSLCVSRLPVMSKRLADRIKQLR